jgi:hypothetical protein
MTLRSPAEYGDGVHHSTATPEFAGVRRSRMVSATGLRTDQPQAEAGIQAESRPGPPIETFGGDDLGVRSLYPSGNFQKIHFEAGLVLSNVLYSAACTGLLHAS